MIPTMILLGLVLGRTWWLALPAAGLLWAVLLLATGVTGVDAALAAGVGLALANAGVGVLVHQACWRAARAVVRRAGVRRGRLRNMGA